MKVAFLVGSFPTLSETFILNQITGLMDRGHSVDIYALEGQKASTGPMHPNVAAYDLLAHTTYLPQVAVSGWQRRLQGLGLLIRLFPEDADRVMRSLNLQQFDLQSRALGYGAVNWLATIAGFLDRRSYDIVHGQFGSYGLVGMVLQQMGLLPGKLVTSFRGYDISWLVQQFGPEVYAPLFEHGDWFIPDCHFFGRRLLQIGCDPQRTTVLSSGVDCDRFTFSPRTLESSGTVRLISTGRLVAKKGMEYGIRAVAQLLKTHPNLEYLIVGQGELRDSLQQLIEDLGVGDRIRLVGPKSQPQLIELLNQSHLLLDPSVTDPDGNQNGPNIVLKEALSMGLPVIGSDHGGIPEVIDDNVSGFLVPEANVAALSDRLTYLIEHPQRWPEMGRAGRVAMEQRYNLETLNDQLVELYQQVLNLNVTQPEKSLVASSPRV